MAKLVHSNEVETIALRVHGLALLLNHVEDCIGDDQTRDLNETEAEYFAAIATREAEAIHNELLVLAGVRPTGEDKADAAPDPSPTIESLFKQWFGLFSSRSPATKSESNAILDEIDRLTDAIIDMVPITITDIARQIVVRTADFSRDLDDDDIDFIQRAAGMSPTAKAEGGTQ